MKHVMAKFGRTVMVAALTMGTAGVASALPLNDSLVDMDFTSTGQITLSLYGPLADGWTNGTLQSGRVTGGSNAFDPLAFFGGQGTSPTSPCSAARRPTRATTSCASGLPRGPRRRTACG